MDRLSNMLARWEIRVSDGSVGSQKAFRFWTFNNVIWAEALWKANKMDPAYFVAIDRWRRKRVK